MPLNAETRWLCWAKATVSDIYLLFFFHSHLNILPKPDASLNLQETAALGSFAHFPTSYIRIPPSLAMQWWDAPSACLSKIQDSILIIQLWICNNQFHCLLPHTLSTLDSLCVMERRSFSVSTINRNSPFLLILPQQTTYANTPTQGERYGQLEDPVLFPCLLLITLSVTQLSVPERRLKIKQSCNCAKLSKYMGGFPGIFTYN